MNKVERVLGVGLFALASLFAWQVLGHAPWEEARTSSACDAFAALTAGGSEVIPPSPLHQGEPENISQLSALFKECIRETR